MFYLNLPHTGHNLFSFQIYKSWKEIIFLRHSWVLLTINHFSSSFILFSHFSSTFCFSFDFLLKSPFLCFWWVQQKLKDFKKTCSWNLTSVVIFTRPRKEQTEKRISFVCRTKNSNGGKRWGRHLENTHKRPRVLFDGVENIE